MNLITFSEKRPALAFSDYLRAQGIANRVVGAEGGFAVALEHDEDGPRAIEEAQAFVAEPDHPRYRQVSWQTGEPQPEAVYGDEVDNGASWLARAGWSTRAVAALCVLVYIGLNIDFRAVFAVLSFPAGISVAAVDGQWWRLLTPAFLHFSLLHIAFNLLWWWELGGLVERAQSPARLLALSLVIAVVSNAVQFLTYGPHFGGLSAVVYGLLGYLWLYPVTDPGAPFRLRPGIVVFMLAWLAIGYSGLLDALFNLQVSNHGHLAGLVAGGALGLLLGLVNYRAPRFED
jgi:GlpG protein